MKTTFLPLKSSAASGAESAPKDLRSLAIQSLEANPTFRGRMGLAAIQIESDCDTLVLSGCLPTYYLKQLLQETVRRVDGVANVENHVLVVNSSGLFAKG